MSTLPANATIPDMLALTVKRHGSKLAIDDGPTRLTWRQLQEQALGKMRRAMAKREMV